MVSNCVGQQFNDFLPPLFLVPCIYSISRGVWGCLKKKTNNLPTLLTCTTASQVQAHPRCISPIVYNSLQLGLSLPPPLPIELSPVVLSQRSHHHLCKRLSQITSSLLCSLRHLSIGVWYWGSTLGIDSKPVQYTELKTALQLCSRQH